MEHQRLRRQASDKLTYLPLQLFIFLNLHLPDRVLLRLWDDEEAKAGFVAPLWVAEQRFADGFDFGWGFDGVEVGDGDVVCAGDGFEGFK